VRDAKLSAEVGGFGGSDTVRSGCENERRENAHRTASGGGHALSNVELTIYDGVDVASGCIGHGRKVG
jgi:hypothetical protein